MRKMKIYCQLLLLVFLSFEGSGLTMEGVSLMGEKEFARLQENVENVLECKYTLNEGDTTAAVTWYHDEHLAFKWSPPDPPQIGEGLREGDAVLTRSDGNLEFASLRTGLAGKYRCEVMTSAGETYKSVNYQLLVIDMPEIPEKVEHKVEDCKITFSWEAPAVSPKPNIACGVWNEKLGYILKGTKWSATPFNNGSIAYSLEDEEFQILQMPLDSLIRCELSITKIDDQNIVLMEREYNFTEVWERGCSPLEVGDGVNLEYDNFRVTCRGEVKPDDDSAPVIAHVKCNEGFTPKYADFVSSVNLVCIDTQWNVGSGLTWNHFDNLVCEEIPKLPERPPTKKMQPMQESGMQDDSTEDEDSSSAVKVFSTPQFLMLLLVATLLSGIIWGLRTVPKKKDPRFMA